MRIAQVILAFASFGIFTALIAYNSKPSKVDKRTFILLYNISNDEESDSDKLSALEKAIIQVESSGNDRAVNNRTNAVGCMQIRPIMVREVNRILSIKGEGKRFVYDDRLSRKKSLDMFRIWRAFHHKNDSREVVARCWNGGTRGHEMTATIKYWNKVKRLI